LASVDEVLHRTRPADDTRRWTEIIATGEPWLGVEVSGETPAQPGVQRTWTENFFPVRVEGKVLGLGAVVEETTERKKAEQALAASEARFRRLIELGPVGIALSEADGRVVLANNAFLQMLGYAPEEADKVNWLEQTAPEHVALSHEHIARLRRGERPVPYEKDYVRRDGTRVTALVVAQFMPGEGDRMMAFAIDISYRKAADRALRESEARLRHLIDHMAGFVALLDAAGTVLEVGEPALRVAGFRREELIGHRVLGRPWWAHDPDLQRRMEGGVREALEGKTIRRTSSRARRRWRVYHRSHAGPHIRSRRASNARHSFRCRCLRAQAYRARAARRKSG
jgi:PAS domain S-box-containing protein